MINMINELLLWVKAIEMTARATYYVMGKIKDVVTFQEAINQSY
jgi:hypothetical protein